MTAPRDTILSTRIPAAAAGQTLLAWLVARFSYLDPAGWSAELAAARVTCNGSVAAGDVVLLPGDVVAYRPQPAPPRGDLRIEPLADGPDFVVVHKPAHLVAHTDGAFVQNTFVRALEGWYAARGAVPSLTLVHRLDRETSGVLLLAKHAAAAAALQRQFAAGTVDKEYLAVVHGVVAADAFDIDAPIGRHPTSPIAVRRAIRTDGAGGARDARTSVQVVARTTAHSLLRLRPWTGRTHQLRVHLEHVGHPLVGDKLYGRTSDEYAAWVAHLKSGGDPARDVRQMLHATVLAFDDPATGARRRFVGPMPADMAALVLEIGLSAPAPATGSAR